MIYHQLAKIYDALVNDDEATQKWVKFTEKYVSSGTLLELACGSGEITLALNKKGYTMIATDLSTDMLEEVQKKDIDQQIKTFQMDMTQFSLDQKFDGILCYCDSINYLPSDEAFIAMIVCVKSHLKPSGVFLFDMHSKERLEEFKEPFIEEGQIEDIQYQWVIQSDANQIFHHFGFWTQGQHIEEEHIQTVFDPNVWIDLLNNAGFETEVMTDFEQPGIVSGEKIFIAGRMKA